MDAKELKPCPFCGSADVRIENFFDPYVACVCGANGNQTEDEDSAIAAWNRRAALPSDAGQAPVEMSPEFTDSARAALVWVLYHHQGGSSPVGQPIRFALGMGAHEPLHPTQIGEALKLAKESHWAWARELLRTSPVAPQAAGDAAQAPIYQVSDGASWNDTDWLEYQSTPSADRRIVYTAPVTAVPEGWKLVPVDPTDEMFTAGERASGSEVMYAPPDLAYRAMIEAAPVAPAAVAPNESAAWGWPWGQREPTTKILRKMAYELKLVPQGEVVCVQFLEILRKQYKAAFAAATVDAEQSSTDIDAADPRGEYEGPNLTFDRLNRMRDFLAKQAGKGVATVRINVETLLCLIDTTQHHENAALDAIKTRAAAPSEEGDQP